MTTSTLTACRACGVATDQRVTHRTEAGKFPGQTLVLVSGVCDDCESLHPDEPGSAVRAALRVLGKDEADWSLAAPVFLEAGLDVSGLLYGEDEEPQRKPWEHVDKDARRRLKAAYVRVLDARVFAASDLDRPVPPHAPEPEYPQACLACGVGKSVAWHGPLYTDAFTPSIALTGVVCDTCEPHLTAAGAVGASFLERAVMEHHGKEWSDAVRLPRLQAWAATGLPPQGKPWNWVTELRDPEPQIEPMIALQIAVKELTERVAALEARS